MFTFRRYSDLSCLLTSLPQSDSFQSDIYPPAPSVEPSLTAAEFFSGKTAPLKLVGLGDGAVFSGPPPSAVPSSAAPPTPFSATVQPSTVQPTRSFSSGPVSAVNPPPSFTEPLTPVAPPSKTWAPSPAPTPVEVQPAPSAQASDSKVRAKLLLLLLCQYTL